MLAVCVQHTRTGGVRRTRLRSRRRVCVLCSIDLDSMSVDKRLLYQAPTTFRDTSRNGVLFTHKQPLHRCTVQHVSRKRITPAHTHTLARTHETTI